MTMTEPPPATQEDIANLQTQIDNMMIIINDLINRIEVLEGNMLGMNEVWLHINALENISILQNHVISTRFSHAVNPMGV